MTQASTAATRRGSTHTRWRRAGIFALAAFSVAASGCGTAGAGGGARRGQPGSSSDDAGIRVRGPEVRLDLPAPGDFAAGSSGASAEIPQEPAGSAQRALLQPAQPATDAVVARVGDLEIRKSQVFDRQMESNRRLARTWIDAVVMDAVVAEMAARYQVAPRPGIVERLAQEEEDLLSAQLEVEFDGAVDLAGYLRRQFGLTVEEYRASNRREITRVRFRSLVIRYLAMLEDRAEVRFIASSDRQELVEARERVVGGADFAALARRLSEDETRLQGGYLAPFGRSFDNPIAAQAFQLDPGEVSEVFTLEEAPTGDATRFGLVYCLQRLPRREQPFAAVADEIIDDLESRPVTAFEQSAFAVQYCAASSPLSGPGGSR